jgi:hypothetical protein
MTVAEFVELYKGRRVRVNNRAVNTNNIGRTAVVLGVISAHSGDRIWLSMDDGIQKGHKATPEVLDLIDNTPLPLPG